MTTERPRAHAQIFDVTNETLIADTTVARDDEPDLWWGLVGDSKAGQRQNDDGSGSIEVPHDHPHADDLTIRRVVRILERDEEGDGEQIKAVFGVNELDWVEVSQAGESDQTKVAAGSGLLARLRDSRVMPWLPITDKPLSAARVFNFASPGLPEDLFDGTVYQQLREAQSEGMRRPVALPEPVSSWIAAYPDDTDHELGDQHTRRHVTLTEDAQIVVLGSADDRFSFWWDGTELMNEDPEYPGTTWWYTFRCGFIAKAGDHVFAARLTNDGGPSALIVGAWFTDGFGLTDPVFVTGTDSGNPFIGEWLMSPVRDVSPGFTGTHIVRILAEEGIARDCFPNLVLDFTDTHDSNGVEVPIIAELVTRVGAHTLRDVLDLLEPWYNFSMGHEGLVLRMTLKETTPESSGVSLQPGVNLLRLTHHMEG